MYPEEKSKAANESTYGMAFYTSGKVLASWFDICIK